MKKNSIKKKKIRRDCWDLDYSWIVWLDDHLSVYLHDADKIINLTFYKFTYKDIEYTQKDLIKLLIEKVKVVKKLDNWDDNYQDLYNEIIDIWKIIWPVMWW